MSTKTCPACGGSGNPSVSGVQEGTANGCMTCGGKGWVYDNNSGGGGGGCFTSDTKVKTADGWKEIHLINEGDGVISINNDGQLATRKVLRKKMHLNRRTLRVQTNNSSFGVTEIHSIKTANGNWKRVGQLNVDDVLTHLDDNDQVAEQTIQCIEKGCSETVYNLIVEGDYTFIVDGCIAHSFTYFRASRIFYYELVRFMSGTVIPPQFAVVAD